MSCVDNWEIPAKHRKEGRAFIRVVRASKPGDLEKYDTWVEREKERGRGREKRGEERRAQQRKGKERRAEERRGEEMREWRERQTDRRIYTILFVISNM